MRNNNPLSIGVTNKCFNIRQRVRRTLNYRKIFASIAISACLISLFTLAIVNGTVASSQAIHMTGSIAYPSPSLSPTPMPTPTPTPATNSKNLAPLPDGFTYALTGQTGIGYPTYSSKIIYPVTWQDKTTLKLLNYAVAPFTGGSGKYDRELDSKFYTNSIKPGDVVTFKAWFWTESSTNGDNGNPLFGANIEIDPLGPNGRICAVNNLNGIGKTDYDPTQAGSNGYDNSGYDYSNTCVPWGSGAWVQLSMTWKVPNTLYADAFNPGYSQGTVVQPTGFCAIIQVASSRPGSEGAAVYISGTELYIN